ncbi:hypothetical protein C8R47DRAFT_1100537 [Mycena vitilis]|nr:hypothetical protein C8R47DRAFT_1100537 [Mycena vitilis]
MAVMKHRLNASSNASATHYRFEPLVMHSRNYSYPPPDFSGSNNSSSPPSSGYSPPYEQSSGRPYYPTASSTRVGHQPVPAQYYAPITPGPAPGSSDRYSSNYSSSAYPPSQYSGPDAGGSGYQPNQPASGSYPFNSRAVSPRVSYHRHSSTAQPPFIPTPSEAYAHPSRPPRPASAMHHRSSGPYASSSHAGSSSPSSRLPHLSVASRPKSSMGHSLSPTSAGERFVCDACGKDFSRAHDRKRHYETQHAATPVTHKCIYCDKDFSRADSLKRHIQNGCDEAPQ